jgi:hypothetical protein
MATAQEQVATANLTLTQAENGQVSTASGAGTAGGAGSASSTGTSGTANNRASNTGTGSSSGTSGTATGSAGISGASGGATTGRSTTTGSTTTTKSSGSSHSGLAASITVAQQALLASVKHIDTLLATTKTDLTLATTLCTTTTPTTPTTPPTTTTPTTPSTPTTPPTTTTPTTPSTTTTPTTPTTTTTPAESTTSTAPAAFTSALAGAQNVAFTTTSSGPATCVQAQQLVLGDETQLFTLQQRLSGQESALDKLISSSAASTGATGAGTPSVGKAATAAPSVTKAPAVATSATRTPTVATSEETPSATKAAGATGSATVVVSAAQLAADQAAVDAANANLVLAQQQLSQASIVSPFTGVVSSVGLTVGQQATAGSSTDAVDVIDPTGHGVTLSVDVTKIPQVKIGEVATVIPDGSLVPLAATVSYIAAAPATSGSTAYNVQLAFNSDPTTLRDGIEASAIITTSQAVNALSVPTSAVNHLGSLSYVLVLNGSSAKIQRVTVGSVGAIYTQVISGLTIGQKVVLANPATPIPTSTVTSRVARVTGGATSGSSSLLGGASSGIGGAASGIGGARTGG